jgi:pyruvate/2-oxoglutarate/acetoin dehydrogenase E1 component
MLSYIYELPEETKSKYSVIPTDKTEIETQGEFVTLVACGHIVITSIIVAQTLASEDVECEVVNLCTFRPLHYKIMFQ